VLRGQIAVVGLAAVLVACSGGDDEGPTFGAKKGGSDASPGADDQAGLPDEPAPGDADGGSCGDGSCGPGESAASCPGDCAVDAGAADGADETKGETGPVDPVAKHLACLGTHCAGDLALCQQTVKCPDLLQCLLGCADTGLCWDGCLATAGDADKQLAAALLVCGHASKCFAQGPKCDWDGKCEAEENVGGCPADCAPKSCAGACASFIQGAPCQCHSGCKTAGSCCADFAQICEQKVTTCLQQGCGLQHGACKLIAGCAAAVICAGNCPDWKCHQGCLAPLSPTGREAALAALSCGTSKACLKTVTPPSCKGKCSSFDPLGLCQCDPNCMKYGDCCDDYAAVCKSPEILACLKSKCAADMDKCTPDPKCATAAQCLAACWVDVMCSEKCLKNAGSVQAAALSACGVKAGCFNP
jgi:poly(U)-specific endoribonuclease